MLFSANLIHRCQAPLTLNIPPKVCWSVASGPKHPSLFPVPLKLKPPQPTILNSMFPSMAFCSSQRNADSPQMFPCRATFSFATLFASIAISQFASEQQDAIDEVPNRLRLEVEIVEVVFARSGSVPLPTSFSFLRGLLSETRPVIQFAATRRFEFGMPTTRVIHRSLG